MKRRARRRMGTVQREVSATRLRTLRALRAEVERLTALFLAPDVEEPRVFDEKARAAIEIVFTVVVDANHAFKRLERLKSEEARESEVDGLCTMISANFDSILLVKGAIYLGLADCEVERSLPLPKGLRELMREHSRLFKLIGGKYRDDNLRAQHLLRLLQLELIWFGQMWSW